MFSSNSKTYDQILLLSTASTLAVFSLISINPSLTTGLFFTNFWLLSYPHTFATYFRKDFFERFNLKTVILIHLIFFGFFVLLRKFSSAQAVLAIYSAAQLWHYYRQNLGVPKFHQVLWHKSIFNLERAVFWLCLLHYFFKEFPLFSGLKEIPYHLLLVNISLIYASLIYRFKLPSKQFLGSWLHACLYIIAMIPDHGAMETLLILGVFHNLQYLKVMGNTNRISMPAMTLLGAVTTFVLLATILAAGHQHPVLQSSIFDLGLSLVFSHYFFDSLIWRKRFMNKSLQPLLLQQQHPSQTFDRARPPCRPNVQNDPSAQGTELEWENIPQGRDFEVNAPQHHL